MRTLALLAIALMSASSQLAADSKLYAFMMEPDLKLASDSLVESAKKHGIAIASITNQSAKDSISHLNREDVVLFIDSNDSLITGSQSEILKAFKGADKPFVIAAENYDQRQNQELKGSYIAYAGALQEFLDDAASDGDYSKGALKRYLAAHPDKWEVDTDFKLFIPVSRIAEEEAAANPTITTGSTPCLIHGEGKEFSLYQETLQERAGL